MLPENTTQIAVTQGDVVKPKEFTDVIRDKIYVDRFIEIFDNKSRAMSYIQSVALLYRSDEKLQACTMTSIIGAALRSASCALQVDPTYRQAYLIPRNRKIKAHKDPATGKGVPEYWITEANFQPHYHGLEILAQRTNIYRYINTTPIYKGQRVLEDVHTGLHYFTIGGDGPELLDAAGNPILAVPPRNSQLRDATKGRQPIEDVIGYLGYFETFKGQKKTEWMTIEEIEAHAKKYSDAYTSAYSLWALGNPHRSVMQMKTVFIRLTKAMDLSGSEHEYLARALDAGDEARQAALEEAGLDQDEPISDTEPRYQEDEFSQAAPVSVTPITVNTTPVTTGGQTQGALTEIQADKPEMAAMLPPVMPIGALPLSYDRAKGYSLGSKKLEVCQTSDLERALARDGVMTTTKNAIRVVLEWRKVNQ